MNNMIDTKNVSAALLSIDEYEKHKEKIPQIKENWWLRSPGNLDDLAACVRGANGDVYDNGTHVTHEFGVRPALRISNPEFETGHKFTFGEQTFTYLGEGLALCDDIVGKCAFREDWEASDANDYEASDVKKYVEDWFEKAKTKEQEDAVKEEAEMDR